MKKYRTFRKVKFSKKQKRTKKNYKSKKQRSKRNKTYRGGDVAKYPPVYGVDNRAVLYPVSKYGVPAGPFDPPALSNGPNGNGPYPQGLYGGRRRFRRNKYHVGGGNQSTFLPQPLVNATRSLSGGLTEIINGFGGYTNSDSLNPMPYNQPLDKNTTYLRNEFPNLSKAYNKADGYVSGL